MIRTFPGTRALRTFEAAARHGNFTHAAREIGLTPAAVSYQIKEIEAQLGLTLFVRNSRSIVLTADGSTLFDAAQQALHAMQHALATVRARQRRLDGSAAPLRLSMGARFATHWMLPRLAAWRAAQPQIELHFDISDTVRDFERDGIDLAIRFGAGRYAVAKSVRLFGTQVVAVCSPALLQGGALAGAMPAEPAALQAHTLCHVDCQVDGVQWPNWNMWMAAAGVDGFDGSACVGFADSAHVLQAVRDGTAAGLLELSMVEAELAQGRLLRLFDIALPVTSAQAYHLVYPLSGSEDGRILAFQTWLLAQLAEEAI